MACCYTGFAVHISGEPEVAECEHPIENIGAVAELGEGRIGKRIGHHVRRLPPQQNELLRMSHRQRLEENGVDEAENRRVGPNAERQRQHGHDRESGILGQHPQAVSKVLK